MSTYLAVWPVLDRRPLLDLAHEAEPDLTRQLWLAGLRRVAAPSWSIRLGRDVPGSRGAAEVLVAVVQVAATPRPDDPPFDPADARRTGMGGTHRVDVERVHHLTREGRSAEQIADQLHCSARSVRRARGRQVALG